MPYVRSVELVWTAFVLKAGMATSLLLGAFLARHWKASWRIVGLMSAFGAGALISGVAVDLVAGAVEEGTFSFLGIGAVLGGLLFTVLNTIVNARGGFLRKASTTITYLRERRAQQLQRELRKLDGIAWFHDLPKEELRMVAGLLVDREYAPGSHIHLIGDRTEHLSIVAEGRVELRAANGDRSTVGDDVFGTNAFLTGAPHSTSAVALEPTIVYLLPRMALFDAIDHLPTLKDRLESALASPELVEYLSQRHGLDPEEIDAWLCALGERGVGTRALDVDRPDPGRAVEILEGQDWAKGLGDHDLAALAGRLYRVRCEDGSVLYQRGDRGDRMYLVERGEVLVVAPDDLRVAYRATAGSAFGTFAFATGLPRSGTAIADGSAEVWVMRRRDLDHLLQSHHAVREAWTRHLESDHTMRYLRAAHGLEGDAAMELLDQAQRSTQAGRAAPERFPTVVSHGAAIAIWLGILLDGIPESLVIGARVGGALPFALIAGAVLSNIPEAMASSRGMAERGMPWRTITLMWAGLVLASGVASAIGQLTLTGASDELSAFLEGVAGGAIITVAAETMLPESYERAGALTGLAALAGFLVAAAIGVMLG